MSAIPSKLPANEARVTSIMWVVHGPPVPKQRPRIGRGGHAYTPEKTRMYERHARTCASVAVLQQGGRWRPTPEDRFVVTVHVFVENGRHGDLDNCVKSALDAAQGSVFHNDKAVVEIHAFLHVGDAWPRVECIASVVEQ